MTIVTGDRYLESLVKFVENQAGLLIEGTLVLKLNPVGLHYVQSRLEALQELEGLLAGAPIDYLRAYVSDLGDHRALEQLRRILRLLPSLKVVSVLPHPARDPTPLPLLPFGRLRVLELRGCDLSTSAARGLLELRHTLEKIVCHNSTDALRHVFASRIAEIKDSPQWNRLSFVSCACNDLVLMDESLQLLPVVETVDLSRNRFAKVDNLRKCSRLKHLDLGFNQLRTVASLSEVSCHIVKLVLRNNALATLRGLENLKSLEGLDLSYNVISNFTELEILCSLPSMQNLWLEGNPLCCARWYRAQVFSYFNTLKVKLDEKEITKREYWKRQIIIASRQKRPASFGFYSPPQDDYEGGGSVNRKQKKLSRLACIENREQSSFLCSDQEAASCDNDTKSRGETAVSDEEAEIVELMNRVELMKKERSVLWLREFKEWMDQPSEDLLDSHKYDSTGAEDYVKNKVRRRDLGESSRHVLDSVQASGDENSPNILESENSLPAKSAGMHGPLYFDQFGEAASSSSLRDTGKNSVPITGKMVLSPERLKSYQNEGINFNSVETKNLNSDIIAQAQMVDAELTPIDDFMESHSSCGCTGSPPHYEEDILHLRQNLVEEILQLSAESFSLASSESHTSESENDLGEFERSMSEDVVSTGENRHLHVSLSGDTYCDQRTEAVEENEKGKFMLDSHAGQASGHLKPLQSDDCLQLCINDLPAGLENGEAANFVDRYTNGVEREIRKRRPKKRVILLSDENNMIGKKASVKLCGDLSSSRYTYNHEDGEKLEFSGDSDFPPLTSFTTPTSDDTYGTLSVVKQTSLVIDDFIQDYFNTNIGDSKVHEICRQYMCCECILERESKPKEREVAVLLSSEQKLYVLLIDIMRDASGTIPTLIGCHKVEEVQEVLVGVGLQVVRVYFEGNVTYLFITRNIEKSRQLISALDSMNASSNKYTLRSLEQIQVKSFEKLICGDSKKSILQYSLVLFSRDHGEKLWLSRSLFVIGSHVLLCIEDFMQFGALSLDASSSPYFLLDSCCSITDVSEMVIETRESPCVTMALKYARSASSRTSETDEVKGIEGLDKEKAGSGSSTTWKIKWFSEDSLFKFVALMKAIHAGATIAPLLVKCI